MVYMFQHDSTHGKFHSTAEGETCHQWEGDLHLPGARSYQHQTGNAGAEKATIYLKGAPKRVIISVPSADTPMMCVSHKTYDNSLKIASPITA